jgi:APA family basic amino acid/polyamine antiporter
MPDSNDANQDAPGLQRELGYWDSLFLCVGGILGAGIYAIVGEAAGIAGGYLWLALAIAAVVAGLTALSYAELVSAHPDAGGGYEYIAQAFGRKAAILPGLLLLLTGIIAPAAIAIAFGDYLGRLVDIPSWMAVVGVIALVAAVNVLGAAELSWVNIAATVVTVLGLLLVIVYGLLSFDFEAITTPPDGTSVWVGASAGAALAFFSFVGFEDHVGSAEETKESRKTVPKALVTGQIVVFVVYLLVAVAAVSLLPAKELAGESGPLSAVMESAAGRWAAVTLTVIALFATSKTILTNMMGASRLLMDMGRDVSWLSVFSRVLPKVNTPVFAIILLFVATTAFALIGNLRLVATISNFAVYGVYVATNVALIKLRRSDDYEPRFRVPGSVGGWPLLPIVAMAALVYLLCFNVYNLVADVGS